ncbi:MAG: hypothetical protein U0175_02275 [Caldilineaceae bacterium]
MQEPLVGKPIYDFLEGKSMLKRIGGGSETDVYLSADSQFVIKIKGEVGTSCEDAINQARTLRDSATLFTAYLGAEHTIPTYFFVAREQTERVNTVAIQPYLANAVALADIDYGRLQPRTWAHIERQLLTILRSALRCYKHTGHMPDLYGAFSRNVTERRQMNRWLKWPQRIWHFFAQRLWQAHNLMLTCEAKPRVVLVDYDYVRWPGLWGKLYYTACWLLFWRDLLVLAGWEAITLIGEEFYSKQNLRTRGFNKNVDSIL